MSYRDNRDTGIPHVRKDVPDLRPVFAEPHHDPRLDRDPGMIPCEVGKKRQRMPVVRPGPDRRIKSRNSFQIVVEDIDSGPPENRKREIERTTEVRDKNLYSQVRDLFSQVIDDRKEVGGPPVRQIVPVHRRHNQEAKSRFTDKGRNTAGFVGIRRRGFSVIDVTEGTGARADPPEDHDSRHTFPETCPEVRTAGFLAHRTEAVAPQTILHPRHGRSPGGGNPKPGGLGGEGKVFRHYAILEEMWVDSRSMIPWIEGPQDICHWRVP